MANSLIEEEHTAAHTHNSIADLAAAEGIKAQGWEEIRDAFNVLAARQRAYERLSYRLRCLLVKADRTAREEAFDYLGKRAKAIIIELPALHSRPALADGECLRLLAVPNHWTEEDAELSTFWAATTWVLGPEIERSGASWLEFYALSRAWGDSSLGSLSIQPCFNVQVRQFIAKSKVLPRDCASPEASHLLRRKGSFLRLMALICI